MIPRRPRLEALPEELLRNIVGRLLPVDIARLRRTCKSISFFLHDNFVDRLLETRMGKLHDGTLICTLTENIRTILGITEDNRVARELRTLIIGTDYPSDVHGRRLRPGDPEFPRMTAPSLHNALKFIAEARRYQISSNRDEANMTRLFGRLENLKTVVIGAGHMEKCSEYGIVRDWYQCSLREEGHKEAARHDHMTSVVLSALAANQTALESFSVSRGLRNNGVVNISTFDELPDDLWKRLPTCFAGLKTLSLAVCNAESHEATSLLPESWMDDEPSPGLQRMLAMTPNLESFELAADHTTSFGPEFTRSILQALPEKLKDIHLHNFVSYSTALVQFLDLRASTLCDVGLTEGNLIGGPWTAVLDRMLSCNLKAFKIGPLYMLEKDGYRWVTFEHPIVGRADVDRLNEQAKFGMYLNGDDERFQYQWLNAVFVLSGYGYTPGYPWARNLSTFFGMSTGAKLRIAKQIHSMSTPQSYDEALLDGCTRWQAGRGEYGFSTSAISTQVATFAKKFANWPEEETAFEA